MLIVEKDEELLDEEELFDGIHLKKKEVSNHDIQFFVTNQNLGSRLNNQELHKVGKNIS